MRPLIDQLAGKRAGYREVYAQLERDPCAEHLGAYRLSGLLALTVCGVHLKRGWRLAFSMQEPEPDSKQQRVVILFVGTREPRHRDSDAWTIVHDLFGIDNPPERHDKLPCCEGGVPNIVDNQLDAFLREVRAMTPKRR